MKFLFPMIFGILFANNAFADCSGFNCTNVKISRMYVTAEGVTYLGTSGDESKLSCDAGANNYIILDPKAPNYDSIYSLLLAAHMSDQSVWVRTTSSGTCKVGYVVSDR